mgnify:CR=1 FL=1
MIRAIVIENERSEQLRLTLSNPLETGFMVANVDGLGPGKATINTTPMATNDGALFNSSRINERTITITFIYLPVPTVEDVRQLSYKYFPLNRKIKLIVETDNRTAEIDGYVESNEPVIFSKQEGATISIRCPNPFFYLYGKLGTNVTVFYGVNALFQFPFSNEGLDPVIELGAIQEKRSQNIYYAGDSEVGMKIIMHALGEVGDVIIYKVETREQMRIPMARLEALTGSPLVEGDVVTINTNKGEKGAWLEREGKTINILNCLDKNTDWLTLLKGDNLLAYSASFGAEFLEFKIENRVIYEGL